MKSLRAKHISELITVEFNFLSEMEWGETINSASVSVEVFSGLDYDTSLLLSGSATVSGNSVFQNIRDGLGGVIYILVCTAEGSSGASYILTRKLAVLSDENSYYPSDTPTLTGTLPDGQSRVAYSSNLLISGGYPPYEFDDISAGTAPGWMTFNVVENELVCAGTPHLDETTDYSFTPQIRDAVNNLASDPQGIEIVHIVAAGGIADGTVGEESVGSYTSVNGVGAVTFAVLSGTFPTGLTLNSDGTVSGEFTFSAVFNWTVRATDSVGNISDVPDTCTVASVEWWYTFADGVSPDHKYIWISEDALTFPTQITPSPEYTYDWGAVDISAGRAFVLSNSAYTDFPDVGDFNTSIRSNFPGPGTGERNFYYIDGIMFWIPDRTDGFYYYSLDTGTNWTAVPPVSGLFTINNIAKVNGIWVATAEPTAGGTGWFLKTSETVPVNWTKVIHSNPSATGGAEGWFTSSGTVAAIFNNDGACFLTSNGTSYTTINTGLTSGDNRDCAYYKGVFVGGTAQNGKVTRSDDGGLTWTNVTYTAAAAAVNRVDTANGLFVISATNGVYVSSDLGLNWTKSTTPKGSASGQWCGHVRRLPS
jgi:hypothetical protein